MATTEPLQKRHCAPCEGGVDPLDAQTVQQWLQQVDQWNVTDDRSSIYRKLSFKNFEQALDFLNRVGEIAEQEQHHPDLHLTGYRNVRIDLTTHAIGGLSENDFILAAKINEL